MPTPELASQLAGLVPEYVAPQYDGEPDDHFRLRETSGTWSLDANEGTGEYTSLGEAITAAEYLVVLHLLLLSGHIVQLHAAGAVVQDRAVLVMGYSGAGKTSLALHWSLHGHPVLGDDIVFIDDEGLAVPFKRLFNVDPARLTAAGATPDPTLVWPADEQRVYWNPQSAGGWAGPAPIHTVAVVRREPDHPLVVQEISKPEALTLMLGSLMPSSLAAGDCFDRLAGVAAGARTLSVVFGDAGEAAAALASIT